MIKIYLTLITPTLSVTYDQIMVASSATLEETIGAVMEKHRGFRPPRARIVLNGTPRTKADFPMVIGKSATLALLGKAANEDESETVVLES